MSLVPDGWMPQTGLGNGDEHWPSRALSASFDDASDLGTIQILHPFYRVPARSSGRAVRWTEVAKAIARKIPDDLSIQTFMGHGIAYIENGFTVGVDTYAPPAQGTMPPIVGQALQEIVSRAPGIKRFSLGVWVGWGSLRELRGSTGTASIGGRDYFCFSSPYDFAFSELDVTPPQTANIWWSTALQVCIVSEVDSWSTQVIGPKPIVARISAHPELEAVRVDH